MLNLRRIPRTLLTALVGVAAILIGIFLVLNWMMPGAHGFIDDNAFWTLKFGTARTSITSEVGQPSSDDARLQLRRLRIADLG